MNLAWSERYKQILKKWRSLSNDQKAPYLQHARDNRSALRMKKAQQVSYFILFIRLLREARHDLISFECVAIIVNLFKSLFKGCLCEKLRGGKLRMK